MAQAKSSKPEYIELLNLIQLQEKGAGVYLKAWADNTSDPGLKHCLNFVAAREVSHGDIFERRLKELGYEVEGTEAQNFAERMSVLGSDMTDAEKIQCIRDAVAQQEKPTVRDRFEAAAEDEAVDPLTRSLLRWFADVESDSGALMQETYKNVPGVS